MSNVIINMEMPKGCYSCPIGIHTGLFIVECPITKSKIDGFTEYIRLSDCPLSPAQEWISVDNPPNNMRDVLVTAFWHEKWQTLMGWYNGKWHVTANDQVRDGVQVRSWMEKPLPKLPNE